ncbi:subtilisin family serine protease [Anaerosolibacter carboniphilus]|uniref:Subtilisin family serine protease n=1 Tax=Anaerosolibacter carboniphilus TaxID=1417629 RepID=A0A841KYW3_9FIRM|nr:S8 family serine peptidase [Anaerosolibacter carboniphilus]MBB6217508.1 subtilisin family serine protease [Anaerosolibacter carboniphilus]
MKQCKIAIVDSGICSHADIPENVFAIKQNFIGPMNIYGDCTGHGTHMAGIIHKTSSQSSLYVAKVLDERNSGDDYDFIRALAWCIENKVDIINISAANPEIPPEPTHELIQCAHAQGIIIVAAGDNNQKTVCYPAKYPEVIGVTSIDRNKNLSAFGYAGEGIDVAACGENIESTWLGNRYMTLSGTSQAAAIVTGLVARLLEKRNDVHTTNIKKLLRTEYPDELVFYDEGHFV